MGERSRSKHKFDGTKVCKTDEVGEDFVNPKIENETFGFRLVCKFRLDFRKVSCFISKNTM